MTVGLPNTARMQWMANLFMQLMSVLYTAVELVCGNALGTETLCPGLEPNENGWTMYASADWYCCGCPPGYRLESDCRAEDAPNSTCVKCDAGTYITEKAHNIRSCSPIPGYVQPSTKTPPTTVSTTTKTASPKPAQSVASGTQQEGIAAWHVVLIVLLALILVALVVVVALLIHRHFRNRHNTKRQQHTLIPTEDENSQHTTTKMDGQVEPQPTDDKWFSEGNPAHPDKSSTNRTAESQTQTADRPKSIEESQPMGDKDLSLNVLMPPATSQSSNQAVENKERCRSQSTVAENQPMSDNDSSSSFSNPPITASIPLLSTPTSSQAYNQSKLSTPDEEPSFNTKVLLVEDETEKSQLKIGFKSIASSWDTDNNDSKPYDDKEKNADYKITEQQNKIEAMYEFFLSIEHNRMIEVNDAQILDFAETFNIKSSEVLHSTTGFKCVSLAVVFKKIYNAQGSNLQTEDIVNYFHDTKQVLLAEKLESFLERAQKQSPHKQYQKSTKKTFT